MDANDSRYKYNKNGVKGARVGQAVADIRSGNPTPMTCGELLDGFGAKFASELEKTVNDNLDKFDGSFYILALTKKEFFADNVVRNWFVSRQTAPHASDLFYEYPNHTKTLYVVNKNKGDIKVAWSIPASVDCVSICKKPHLYHPELVKWINDCVNKKLDIDSYDFLFK